MYIFCKTDSSHHQQQYHHDTIKHSHIHNIHTMTYDTQHRSDKKHELWVQSVHNDIDDNQMDILGYVYVVCSMFVAFLLPSSSVRFILLRDFIDFSTRSTST